jgi:hypothetical protein
MKDFWLSCGHHLLDRRKDGRLAVTDEFLKAYIARRELMPPPEACAAERNLRAALLREPRRFVEPAEIAAIADADARENWTLLIAFRDLLVAQGSIEAAYLHLARHGFGNTPLLFINQLVHLILRNVLDACEDAFMLRAAELFFRPQRLTTFQDSLIAANNETLAGAAAQHASPLISLLGLPANADIEVLNEDNAESYWDRSDRFDLALDVTSGRRGIGALGNVIARWVSHLLAIQAEVEPLIAASDVDLTWYVGLDADGTRIGDALWNGEELDEARRSRIVGLYRLRLDPDPMMQSAKPEPIYLIMAMTPDGVLRMKPQNLVTGLPIPQQEAVR